MNLMKDTSEYKMNTYIYAPKDDPYHRLSWKELYPEQEAKQIAELAKAGAEIILISVGQFIQEPLFNLQMKISMLLLINLNNFIA